MTDKVSIDNPVVIDRIRELLNKPIPASGGRALVIARAGEPIGADYEYSNFSEDAPYTPYSTGFRVTDMRTGISISCSEGTLVENIEAVCKTVRQLWGWQI